MEAAVVLITGGSSGIGAATATILADSGMKVYAGSRRGSLQEARPGIVPIKLDVNDAESLKAAVDGIIAAEGRLDAVVCNAGNGIYGPVEYTSEADARAQFETCYFGAVKTIQACLPVFRKQGRGRIITVTSVMAVLELPYQVYYSSVKAALLSLTEGLRMELKGSGIQCCSILPGDVATGFTSARRIAAPEEGTPYDKGIKKNLAKIEKDELGGMKPEVIGRAILRQLKKKRMSVRVTPRLDYKAVSLLVRIIPSSWRLAIINALYN
ncbi:MAG: SDR family oxidoreductase [Bacteroidales bacterium]|nr:SDR family oxidoreductase [Bacteroidales bacterium]